MRVTHVSQVRSRRLVDVDSMILGLRLRVGLIMMCDISLSMLRVMRSAMSVSGHYINLMWRLLSLLRLLLVMMMMRLMMLLPCHSTLSWLGEVMLMIVVTVAIIIILPILNRRLRLMLISRF